MSITHRQVEFFQVVIPYLELEECKYVSFNSIGCLPQQRMGLEIKSYPLIVLKKNLNLTTIKDVEIRDLAVTGRSKRDF